MADNAEVPLVVDLDGTVIRTDLTWESLARLLRRNPLALFQVLFWLARGRACLKQKLAARVRVDPAALPYHEPLLAWLRQQKAAGRRIILATASDRRMAEPVAAHLGLFDEILASDGKINLRQESKRRALVAKFGERGFDYAGNSRDDLVVWRSARQAIVVNASPKLQQAAARITALGPCFCAGYAAPAIGWRFVRELFWRSGYLVAAGGGLLLALAFPKFSIAGFAWVAPALLVAAARGQSGANSFRAGYVSGLVFWLISLYWLMLMPAMGFPILGWLALAAYTSLYVGTWVWLMSRFPFPAASWRGRLGWTLTGAAAWVALEMFRGWFLGGFPWSFLAASQYQLTPLLQLAAFTGVQGVSFLVVWFSLALYSTVAVMLREPGRRLAWQAEIALPLCAVLACYIGGSFAMNHRPQAKEFLRVTTIQPSFPQTLIWNDAENARRFAILLELSQLTLTNGPARSDLLVWPESAVPSLDDSTYLAINRFVQSNHVWLILNGDDVELHPHATNYFNSAFLVGPDGRWRQAYHKRDLVIFGEYVPLAHWLPFLKYLTPIEGGWTAGDKPATFELARPAAPPLDGVIQITTDLETMDSSAVHCAPLICFEDTFAGTVRASASDDDDFLITLTNDGWFRESAEQRQHLANAVFRAVENGLPLLRCANNGVTCLIDERGRLDPVFQDANHSEYGRGGMTVQIPLLSAAQKPGPTFYHRHGNWFGWSCVLVALLAAVRQCWLNRRLQYDTARTIPTR